MKKVETRENFEYYRNNLYAFLKELVCIQSLCGSEKAAVDRIEKEAAELGYDNVRVDAFGNMLASIGSGKRILAIDGHCDTVAAGDENQWPHHPFNGDVTEDRLYGRGAADQKSGLAAALYAGSLAREGLPEDCTLLIVASVMEEDFEGLCWKHIIEKEQCIPEFVLLTEPTDMEIRYGQRGRLEMAIEVKGKSCHGSAPERGENAIYESIPLIDSIQSLDSRLKGALPLGKGSIALTRIASRAPSLCAVPDSVILQLDRRLTSGETRESALNEIRALPAFKSIQAEVHVPEYNVRTYTGYECSAEAYYPMWLMDSDHELTGLAEKAFLMEFGRRPDVGVWQFSTNGVVTNGVYEIPTIGFGPGLERHAHTIEDQVKLNDVYRAMCFYTRFIDVWGARSG